MPNIIEITDFDAPELDIYARLTENQLLNRHEPEKGLFIAESPKVIERALDAGCVPVSLLLERKHIEGQARDVIARCKDIPVYTASFDVFNWAIVISLFFTEDGVYAIPYLIVPLLLLVTNTSNTLVAPALTLTILPVWSVISNVYDKSAVILLVLFIVISVANV